MTVLSEKEIESKRERSREKHELAVEIAESNEKPPAGELADRTRELGVFTLLLEDADEALGWFAEATDWYLERWHQLHGEINEPQMVMWALFTAILSRDDDLVKQTAEEVRKKGIEHQEPEYYVHLDEGLVNLVLGNDEQAAEAADVLLNLEPDAPKRVGSYPGLGGACHAIVDDDVTGLNKALSSTLNHHEELKEQRPEGLDHIVICFPATVFLLLARDRGLPIENTDVFQSEYVPAAIFE